MEERLRKLKIKYMNTPIPEELDFTVQKAIKEGERIGISKNQKVKAVKIAAASIAAAFLIMIVGVNTNTAFADALSKIPLVGKIVKVLIVREYHVDEETYEARIDVPEIQGLDNKALEYSLNQKYWDEAKELYDRFQEDMENLEKAGGGHLGIQSGTVIKTDDEKLLSIGRYTVNTVGSSSTTIRYDTVDKENEVLITLPSLFMDDSYITIISENIKEQMIKRNKEDENMFYWVEGIKQQGTVELFEEISPTQNFYINIHHQLVISFDKYEVAPGYMGLVEFVIPTDILQDILVGNSYIK